MQIHPIFQIKWFEYVVVVRLSSCELKLCICVMYVHLYMLCMCLYAKCVFCCCGCMCNMCNICTFYICCASVETWWVVWYEKLCCDCVILVRMRPQTICGTREIKTASCVWHVCYVCVYLKVVWKQFKKSNSR